MRAGKGTVEGDKGSVSLPTPQTGAGQDREMTAGWSWMELYSPQTFAAGRGPGIGRECWRRVTSWAAACLCCLRSVAAGCLSVPPRLSAGGGTAAISPWPCQPLSPVGTSPCPVLGPASPQGHPVVPTFWEVPHGCPFLLGNDGGAMGMLRVGVQMLHSGPCGRTGKR